MGLVLLDPELRYALVNGALAELNGVAADDHLGLRPEDVVPELAPGLVPILERVLAGEAIVNLEFDVRIAARPGPRTTLESYYPLLDAEGAVAGIGGVVVDITDRREAQRARDDATALIDALFDTAPIGMGFWDRDLRFQRINHALAEMNGIPVEAHRGRTLAELLPGVSPEVTEILRGVVEDGTPVIGAETSGETPAAPGIQRHWSVSYYPVRDASGAILGAGAVCAEITDLRHARDSERYLRELLGEERAVLREVVARAPAGIALLWGAEDRVRLANERFCDIARLQGDPTGQTFEEALPELWWLARPLLDEVRATGSALAREDLAIPAKDLEAEGAFQGKRYMTFTLDPVTAADGAGTGILVVVMETTARVRQRAELERQLREERRTVTTLQRALLPRTLPEVPHAMLAARYEAAGARFDVGGDFYDAFPIAGDGWLVVVGDVCGKGAEAAALTAMARYTLRAEASHADGPAHLLGLLNEEMLLHEAEAPIDEISRFSTVACAWLRPDAEGLSVRLACGGQPDPLVLRGDGGVEPIHPKGPPCGAFPDVVYEEASLRLSPGEALVLYTDGVLDAGAPARQMDVADLARALAVSGPADAGAIADRVAAIVREQGGTEPRDDYAVLVIAAR